MPLQKKPPRKNCISSFKYNFHERLDNFPFELVSPNGPLEWQEPTKQTEEQLSRNELLTKWRPLFLSVGIFLLAILVILVVCGCCFDWKSSISSIFLNGSQEKPSPRFFKIVNNESVTKSNIPNIKYHFIVIPMKHIAQQNVMERKNHKINRWKFTLIEYRLRA